MSRARQDRTAARGCGQPHPSRPCAHLPAARGLLGRQCAGVVRLVKQIMQPSTSQEIDRYLPTGEHNAPPNSSSWVIWLHMKSTTKPEPTWRNVKAKVEGFEPDLLRFHCSSARKPSTFCRGAEWRTRITTQPLCDVRPSLDHHLWVA